MKKLKLSRETLSVLNASDLSEVQGGVTGIIIVKTAVCPVVTNGCTGGPCVMTGGGGTVGSCTAEGCAITITGTGTSVINPGGGF